MPINNTPMAPLPDITVEDLLDSQLCCIAVSTSTRQAIDDFAEIIRKRQEGLLPGAKVFYIFDFSQSFAGFNTPYGRHRMDEMSKASEHLIAYSAIILPNTFLLQVSRILIEKFQRKGSTNRIFLNRADGVQWLQKEMAKA